MILSPDMLAFLVAAALMAGCIDAMAGGGGLITLPALMAAGIPPVQAVATNKLQSCFGTFGACVAYARRGHMDLKTYKGPVIAAFIETHGQVVVKPARGEQGRGIAVGIDNLEDAKAAIEAAREVSDRVLMEACFIGDDLRLIVIDYRLVAAAVRRPPEITGDGHASVRDLIETLSRRRSAATGGESRVPRPSAASNMPAMAWTTCCRRASASPCARPPISIPAGRSTTSPERCIRLSWTLPFQRRGRSRFR